jgi:DNA polymerase (family 10)
MSSKNEVARVLEQIGACLELKSENAFRVRAYQTAARTVAGFTDDLAESAASGKLAELKGIGPATLQIIVEVLATGRSTVLDNLRKEIPSGLVDMMQISGLGVAKIRQIHDSLGIATLSELENAAQDGRLASLPRFGPKMAQKVLRSLQFVKRVGELRLFHHARAEAQALLPALQRLSGVTDASIVGDIRRRREVIENMEFLVGFDGSTEELAAELHELADVTAIAAEPGGVITITFTSGSVASLRASRPGALGFHLVGTTGSAEHLKAMARRADDLGLTWTDHGITAPGEAVECATEEDVYGALDLQWIPPELREGQGEVEAAAQGELPHLVELGDLRGFLHCHSNYSDGTSTVRDWTVAARDAGYEYVGITDHSEAATYAGGLYRDNIRNQHEEIDRANAEVEDVTVLKGIEVDILQDGSLDYTSEIRATFDFVIASLHSGFGQDRETTTKRILRAMDDPDMGIFGHPTGRLLLSRDPYPMDLDAIFDKAAERGIAIEINADPQRLDLDWRLVRSAVSKGVKISIGADAHNVSGMTNMELGVGIARKGWLSASDVLNTQSLQEFLQHVAQRREN